MTTQTIERTTLSNLVFNEEYCRKVLPFIKPDYFDVKEERVVFEEITNFVDKYKKIPTKISLEIEVESRKDLTEDQHRKIVDIIQTLDSTDVDMEWLVDTMQYQVFLQMPLLFVLIMPLAMIILTIVIKDLSSIIE